MQNGDQNVGEPIASTQNLPVCQNEPKAFQKFQMQRMKWPPLDPHDILRAQQKATFTNASADDVMDFVFHCTDDARLDKLYLFFRELSKAGVFVDLLYWGSVHHQLINACGFKGSDAVPAVSTKLCPSINCHISTSGRIRLDGRMEQREILASLCCAAHFLLLTLRIFQRCQRLPRCKLKVGNTKNGCHRDMGKFLQLMQYAFSMALVSMVCGTSST